MDECSTAAGFNGANGTRPRSPPFFRNEQTLRVLYAVYMELSKLWRLRNSLGWNLKRNQGWDRLCTLGANIPTPRLISLGSLRHSTIGAQKNLFTYGLMAFSALFHLLFSPKWRVTRSDGISFLIFLWNKLLQNPRPASRAILSEASNL